jgi:prolyl 4-hydroxylase
MRRFVQCFDQAFAPDFCAQMLRSFESLARFHVRNGKGVRAGHDDSSWLELDITPFTDQGFQAMLQDRMQTYLHQYNQALNLPLPIPPSQRLDRLVIKRYQPGPADAFQVHFDALGSLANRYLVFLWYLNDVEHGGETYFPTLDMAIQPKAGRLLMFPPYWMFQHEGKAPRSGEKFIFSTYYLF